MVGRAEWFDIHVTLTGLPETGSEPGPGRIILAAPAHSFLSLADAIDQAFGRWAETENRRFVTGGEEEIVVSGPDPDQWRLGDNHTPTGDFPGTMPIDRFRYIYRDGLTWEHDCLVSRIMVDPRVHRPTGRLPRRPFAVDGWGWLPDPLGRRTEFDQPRHIGVSELPPSGGIPDEDHELVRSYCENKIPKWVRDQIRLDCERTDSTLTITEYRPPWNPEMMGPEWTTMPIAQFTHQDDGSWSLQCRFSDERWYEYDPMPTSPDLASLLAEVDSDPTAIFWG